tara:strand:- start:389 stop:604 length:216 start_codon:yes stop_codon:yes gene_type:complete
MKQNPITIRLDEIVLKLDSKATKSTTTNCIYLLRGTIKLPGKQELDVSCRYDFGKRVLIDPLLQYDLMGGI